MVDFIKAKQSANDLIKILSEQELEQSEKLMQFELDLATKQLLIKDKIAHELTEGKPKYKNEDQRAAELERQLAQFVTYQDKLREKATLAHELALTRIKKEHTIMQLKIWMSIWGDWYGMYWLWATGAVW